MLVESLLPQDSFYRRFRELLWPLIQEADFASLYCTNNGRPALSPALLARVLILQFHENRSDREMEAACQYDLRLTDRPRSRTPIEITFSIVQRKALWT